MASTADTVKRITAYAAAGTIGSLLIGYGLREFLRATGGYYCCYLAQHQGNGIVLTFLGWIVLIVAAVNFPRDLLQ